MKQALILLALLAAATLHAAEPAAVNYDEDPYVILVGEAEIGRASCRERVS